MKACPVCGLEDPEVSIRFKGYDYRRCRQCSLVFLDADTVLQNRDLYASDYIRKRGHDRMSSSIVKAKEKTAARYLSILERYTIKGQLLEVGCSTGATLKAAKEKGWKVYGVEVNETAAVLARQFLNIETIKIGNLTKDLFQDKFFSAVLLFDVLEHISEPSNFIEILKNKLQPSGCLLIITPNISSLSAKILKNSWPHLFLEHQCLYSPKSIRLLLEKYGFRILKLGWAIKFVSLDILRRHLECHPQIFLAQTVRMLWNKLGYLENLIFPFNIGEMYVLAQKYPL